MIIRNRYMSKVRPFFNKPVIKIFTGIRRAGKSTIMRMIQQELLSTGVNPDQIFYVNFESSEFLDITSADILIEKVSAFHQSQSQKTYLFFDEIQQVEGWEKAVNSFLVDHNTDIYITGSNATLLSGALSTLLAGRYIEIQIHPFSFSEFTQHFENSELILDDLFRKFITFGGMPFLSLLGFDYEPSMQYLRDIYSSVVIKDIITHNNLRDVDLLDRLIRFVIANTGQIFSATSIMKYFKNEGRKVAVDTILEYLLACEEAFLLSRVKREDLVGKKILQVQEKFYVEDHGLRQAVVGNNEREIQIVLETIIFNELRCRGYEVTVGDNNNQEIDFVCQKDGTKSYFQVSYLLADEATISREFSAFKGIDDNYSKYVLSLDKFDMSRDGIIHKNIVNYLLEV